MDYDTQDKQLQRRQKMAQALMQQGQQPLQGHMAGRFYVPPSPFQGAANIANQLVGASVMKDTERKELDLGKQRRESLVNALKKSKEIERGGPTLNSDGSTNMVMPERSPDPQAAAESLISSEHPIAQQLGSHMYERQGKSQDRMQELRLLSENRRSEKEDERAWRSQQEEANRAIRLEIAGRSDKPKLKPGERFTTDGQVEAIPGSDVFVKQSGLHGKDFAALNAVDTKTKNAISKIDEILVSPGFDSNFGGYNAYATQFLPGESSNARKSIESIKSDLKSAGLELIRQGGAIGQMTEREWPIVERMISNIDPVLSEDAAKQELEKVKAYMQKIRENARTAYDTEWGKTQFHKPENAAPSAPHANPSAGPQVGQVINGYRFNGGNPNDKNSWSPQ